MRKIVLTVEIALSRLNAKEYLNLMTRLKSLIEEHTACTGSSRGKEILEDFESYLPKFKKIIPDDYKRMLSLSMKLEEQGMTSEQAQMEAFTEVFSEV